ncbi:hypothetical protein [Corynebacterium halotolerans]|uniref:hypothetical protein n=1 Tax=Corynebacterium halotolerans TaxID=225326 RepID=UPI003CF11B47
MSADSSPTPKHEVETFPAYEGRMHYIEGYTPVSLGAPHSSLERTATWAGMGFLLVGLVGIGMVLYGLATSLWGGDENSNFFMIAGAIVAVVICGGGLILINRGRQHYKKYRRETGRSH